jgi:hypothetical protein
MQINYDYQGFDATAQQYNSYKPKEGNYTVILLGAAEKQIDGSGSLLELEFFNEGDDKAYTVSYLTGWTQGDYMTVRRIAYEGIGRIYYGITGQQPPANGFDIATLFNHKFSADLTHRADKKDANKVYVELKNIKPFASGTAPVTAPVTATPAAPAVAAGPQTYGKPAWAQ